MPRFSTLLSLFIVITLAHSTTGCKKEAQKKESSFVVYTAGKVLRERNNERTKLKPRDTIESGDRIITKKQSTVTLQIMGVGLIRLPAESEFTLAAADDKEIRGLLEKGKIGTKFLKLKKRKVILSTTNTVAAVRGTVYGLNIVPGGTNVPVSEGKVAVAPAKGGKEVIIAAGKTAVVSTDGKIKTRTISTEEKQALAIVAKAKLVPNFLELSEDEAAKIIEEFQKRESTLGEESGDPGKSKKKSFKNLAEMKEAYDKLDEVVLFNGKKIKGKVVKQDKDFLFVQVPGGMKKIKKTDVSARNILK